MSPLELRGGCLLLVVKQWVSPICVFPCNATRCITDPSEMSIWALCVTPMGLGPQGEVARGTSANVRFAVP